MDLILIIHPLHAVADGSENFVRDGFENIREDGHGQVIAEYFHDVALLTGDVRDINHRHIHTDIAYIGSLEAVDQAIAPTPSEMPIQPVGITYGNGRYDTVALRIPFRL